MQRHGGSNRSIPKIRPFVKSRPDELPVPETQAQAAYASDVSAKSERSDGVAER
jgi:hypothetical protein